MTLMELQPGDRILELGCGNGWVCRQLAGHIPEGIVIGLDLSDEHIRDARAKSTSFENVLYLWSVAEQIPWQEDFFTRVVCVDSIRYFQDWDKVFRETYRVLVPGGTFWILDKTRRGDGGSEKSPSERTTPVRLFTLEEYVARLRQCEYEDVSSYSLQNSSPGAPSGGGNSSTPGGAMLLSARKPQM